MSKRTTAKKNRKQKTSQPSVKAHAQALQDYLERRGDYALWGVLRIPCNPGILV